MNLLIMNKLNDIDRAVKGMQLTYADALKSNNESINSLEDQCSKLVEQSTVQMNKAVEVNRNAEKLMQKSNEISEADARKCNVILYGVPEGDKIPVLKQVEKVIRDERFKNFDKPHAALRLGKKSTETARPIKVVFETIQSKWAS